MKKRNLLEISSTIFIVIFMVLVFAFNAHCNSYVTGQITPTVNSLGDVPTSSDFSKCSLSLFHFGDIQSPVTFSGVNNFGMYSMELRNGLTNQYYFVTDCGNTSLKIVMQNNTPIILNDSEQVINGVIFYTYGGLWRSTQTN